MGPLESENTGTDNQSEDFESKVENMRELWEHKEDSVKTDQSSCGGHRKINHKRPRQDLKVIVLASPSCLTLFDPMYCSLPGSPRQE